MAETSQHCKRSSGRNETHFSNLPLGQYSHCSTPTKRMQSSSLHGNEIWHTVQIQTFGLMLVSFHDKMEISCKIHLY